MIGITHNKHILLVNKEKRFIWQKNSGILPRPKRKKKKIMIKILFLFGFLGSSNLSKTEKITLKANFNVIKIEVLEIFVNNKRYENRTKF